MNHFLNHNNYNPPHELCLKMSAKLSSLSNLPLTQRMSEKDVTKCVLAENTILYELKCLDEKALMAFTVNKKRHPCRWRMCFGGGKVFFSRIVVHSSFNVICSNWDTNHVGNCWYSAGIRINSPQLFHENILPSTLTNMYLYSQQTCSLSHSMEKFTQRQNQKYIL